MKILFLSSLYPPHTRGGGELSTHYIAQALTRLGHEVVVITAGQRREEREVEGVRVLALPLNLTAKPLFERRHARRLARQLRRQYPDLAAFDIVHAHDFRTAQVLSELGLPRSIVTARDYAQICGSPNNLLRDGTPANDISLRATLQNQAVVEAPWWRKPFRIWQYAYNINYRLSSFKTFRHQIFISHAQRAEIARVQDLSNAMGHVIYNPVPPTYLASRTSQPVGKNLLYVGTMQDYKGVPLLLEAFKQLAGRDSNIHLKLVGDGASRHNYEAQIDQWGLQYRVSFTGRLPYDRLQSLYDEAAVVVAPHVWTEPFGRVVVEAMARGRLVVTSNVGGPAEMVQSGQTGFLFERGSVESLVRTIEQALALSEYDRRMMQQRARDWVAQHLDPAAIAAQHEAVYREILSRTTSGVNASKE